MRRLSLFALYLLAAGAPAWADLSERLNFSAFGTLAWTVGSVEGVEYRRGLVPEGADSDGSFLVDSRLGLQLDAAFTDRLSTMAQVLAQQDAEGDFMPDLSIAILRGQIDERHSVRVGRMGDRVFLDSHHREVGYANTMVRPPEDVYRLNPLRSYDGIDLLGEYEFGEWLTSLQLYTGVNDIDWADEYEVRIRDIVGAILDAERGRARWRLSYVQSRLSSRWSALDRGAENLALAAARFPSLADEAEDLDGSPKRTRYGTLGLRLDLDPLVLSGEIAARESEGFFPDATSGYLSAAYRAGEVTPYVFVSAVDQTSRTRLTGPDEPTLAPLIESVEILYRSISQKTAGVGARWDFTPGLAFKVQLEHIDRDSVGQNFIALDGLPADGGESVRLLTLGLDFVY